VLLETSDLLEVVATMKVVWRFVVKECGAQSVTIFGVLLMLMLCVDSLAIPIWVSYQMDNYTCSCSHEMHMNVQVLLQDLGHFLAREVETYCWIMWPVLELRPDSLTAPITVLVYTTVPILKMLELLVKLLPPHHVGLHYVVTFSDSYNVLFGDCIQLALIGI
jgi:hypothetical protein